MDDRARKMMQKWGWTKGQGLGKDNKGMTSCLVLRKDAGSTSQGRIELSATTAAASETAASQQPQQPVADPSQAAANSLLSSIGAELGVAMPDDAESAAKRRKTRWGPLTDEGTDKPADSTALVPAGQQQLGQGILTPGPVTPAATSQATGGNAAAAGQVSDNPNYGEAQANKKKIRVPYIWPKHYDDWRWSKGMEATYCFEEVALPSGLLSLAKRILGEGSRFPTRVADASDCEVEVTAWGSLLVRPKGTGGNIDKAKKMLFEVLHPAAEQLREEAFEVEEDMPDDDAKDADAVGPQGLVVDEKDKETLANQKKRRIGLSAKDDEDRPDDQVALESTLPLETVEIPLPTTEDVQLVHKHLKALRTATGVTPVLNGASLKLTGRGKKYLRAQQLVQTLLDSGEWVAFSEAFVLSEETKDKRRGDGPSEQLLIKLPDGAALKLVEKNLRSMEAAAEADQLKLTSKAIAGKRTLMVEGPPKAHERVKLMVKELMEKGESPMLTKFLSGSKVGMGRSEVVAFSESFKAGAKTSTSAATPAPKAAGVQGGSQVAPGVVAAKPVITSTPEAEKKEETKKELPQLGAGFRLMAPPARAPAAKPAAKVTAATTASSDDLFAGLPEPDAPVDAAAAAAGDGVTE